MARIKLLHITKEYLADLFKLDGTRAPHFEGVPKDGRIVEVFRRHRENVVTFMIESQEFPDVPMGEPFPQIFFKEVSAHVQKVPIRFARPGEQTGDYLQLIRQEERRVGTLVSHEERQEAWRFGMSDELDRQTGKPRKPKEVLRLRGLTTEDNDRDFVYSRTVPGDAKAPPATDDVWNGTKWVSWDEYHGKKGR